MVGCVCGGGGGETRDTICPLKLRRLILSNSY